jgi:hypothetical protein
MSAIGVLIITIASMNFVNLTTARVARRAVEVGVRKATGADRKDIAVQFLSESAMYAVLGMLAGLALARTLLPSLNAYLGRLCQPHCPGRVDVLRSVDAGARRCGPDSNRPRTVGRSCKTGCGTPV